MKCPVDGATLVMTERSGVEIDYCPQCRGVWLDRGELDKILERATPAVALQEPARPEARMAAPPPLRRVTTTGRATATTGGIGGTTTNTIARRSGRASSTTSSTSDGRPRVLASPCQDREGPMPKTAMEMVAEAKAKAPAVTPEEAATLDNVVFVDLREAAEIEPRARSRAPWQSRAGSSSSRRTRRTPTTCPRWTRARRW
jgi:Zn-finger nucleic acid-binding protein